MDPEPVRRPRGQAQRGLSDGGANHPHRGSQLTSSTHPTESITAENPLAQGIGLLPPQPTALIVFGAGGDLAKRKLLPAVANLAADGTLPDRFSLICVSRDPMTDDDFRGMVRIAFLRAGYTVHEAENGNAALDVLAGHSVDLVVTDIIMPEADGYEVILRLKEQKSHPPLIAVTGGSLRLRMELPGMARLLGAESAFEKPVDLKALLAEAGRLIAARKAAENEAGAAG